MSVLTKNDESRVKLTSGERLARGLKEVSVAPIDITRGSVGLGYGAVKAVAGKLFRRGKVVSLEVQDALADAADVLPVIVAGRRRRRRRALTGLAVVGLLGAGAAAFSAVRRSSRPEPSPLAPSVNSYPQP